MIGLYFRGEPVPDWIMRYDASAIRVTFGARVTLAYRRHGRVQLWPILGQWAIHVSPITPGPIAIDMPVDVHGRFLRLRPWAAIRVRT